MYACMYVYMYVCMYIMYICIFVCMYVCIEICIYACMYVCMHVCIYACMYTCMNICKNAFIYVCEHMQLYTHVFIHNTHLRMVYTTHNHSTGGKLSGQRTAATLLLYLHTHVFTHFIYESTQRWWRAHLSTRSRYTCCSSSPFARG